MTVTRNDMALCKYCLYYSLNPYNGKQLCLHEKRIFSGDVFACQYCDPQTGEHAREYTILINSATGKRVVVRNRTQKAIDRIGARLNIVKTPRENTREPNEVDYVFQNRDFLEVTEETEE